MQLPSSSDIFPINVHGQYLYSGGLQVRGALSNDSQLSLHRYWHGEMAFHNMYRSVLDSDVPIAQDCFGDQYLDREGIVYFLSAETGDTEKLNMSPDEFIQWAAKDPIENLNLPEELNLEQGFLLHAYPPFCTKEGSNASVKAVPNDEVILFHADFANQIVEVEEGGQIEVKLVD